MEKLSRVKKYEELRKQIEEETSTTESVPEKQLQGYAQRLNEIDPSIFKKVTISEDEEPYTPVRERKESELFREPAEEVGEFRNEYLDDFINEVREYNIKKGTRENENTQIDILNQLQASTLPKRSNYVENIVDESEEDESESMSFSKDEIRAQLKNFILETDDEQEEEPIILTSPIDPPLKKEVEVVDVVDHTREIAKSPIESMIGNRNVLDEEEEEIVNPSPVKEIQPDEVELHESQAEVEREQLLQQKLVEETQQLRVQLNEYEDDLNDLSVGVEKTNKMLNIVLGCLIFALLIIIGIIVYWVIQAGGLV